MGFPIKVSLPSGSSQHLKVPEKCPFCGSELFYSEKNLFGGCSLCSKVAISEPGAEAILDLSNAFKPQSGRSRKNIRANRKTKTFQRNLNFDTLELRSPNIFAKIKNAALLSFLGLVLGAALGYVYFQYYPLLNYINPIVEFPSQLIIEDVKLFKSGENYKVKFSVKNNDITEVVGLTVAVGIFDFEGELVSFTTADVLKGSSKIYRSKLSGIPPGEKRNFTITLSGDVFKVSVIPVTAEMFI